MDAQNGFEHGHIIEVCADVVPKGIKVCGVSACGFSDAKNNSVEAKERTASMRKLVFAVVLCVIFMVVEVIGGIKANSLAILTDAAHLLSDVAAFAISLFSLWASGWEANPRQSYGFFRIEILGALVSIQMIWLLTGILVFEAIQRLLHETGEVQGFLMFGVSAIGLLVNIVMALILGHEHHSHSHGHSHGHDHGHSHEHGHGHSHEHYHGHAGHNHSHENHHEDAHSHGTEAHHHDCHSTAHSNSHGEDNQHVHDHSEPLLKKPKAKSGNKKQQNINVQGAYLHVLGDFFQSIGVMIGGAIIWFKPEWKIVDLICTLLFSIIVLATTIRMLCNILEVLMESTPREIDATRLEKELCEMEEIVTIHELHIWAITIGKVLLACHVIIKPDADADMVLEKVIEYIRRVYNISHVTIQIERGQA
ncbi:hypothetical protein QQ045_008705 [Rhodiola kirilowii]